MQTPEAFRNKNDGTDLVSVRRFDNMKITIVGAGNIGTQFAAHCAEKGHSVIVYGSKPDKISNELFVINENDEVIHRGIIEHSTNEPSVAFTDAELIFVTYPAFCMKAIADIIKPFVSGNTKIAIIPGTGGGECAFRDCIEKGATVFGLQRVPSVARLVEYGKCVRATGYRDELYISALPNKRTDECRRIIEDIFEIKCSSLPCYLNLTLTPSNPILHTTRLKTIFEDYKEGIFYKYIPLFYEEWDDKSSELLFLCDEEVQLLCQKLKMFDLSYVKSLKIHYESSTPQALTKKISSILGFKGLESPVIKTENGLIPDLNSRYFTADFPYGLSILVQIAQLAGLDVPNMIDTLNWYYDIIQNHECFSYLEYGINDIDDFISFYSV